MEATGFTKTHHVIHYGLLYTLQEKKKKKQPLIKDNYRVNLNSG